MRSNKNNFFKTPDLYLSAALKILLNVDPEFEVTNAGKVLFSFAVSDSLYRAMNEFNSGIPLNAIEFAETIKKLRAEMFMRRGQRANGGY